MINPDILRVMAELHTFTSEDLAKALDCPVGTTGGLLPGWVKDGYVIRLKFNKTYLYALSQRGERMVAKLPPVDPNERCLPLVRVNITDRYLYHNDTPVLDTSEDELPVISEYCRGCGEEFINLPVTGRCHNCEKLWHS